MIRKTFKWIGARRWLVTVLVTVVSASLGAAVVAGVSLWYWPTAPALQSMNGPGAWSSQACEDYVLAPANSHAFAWNAIDPQANLGPDKALYPTQMWDRLETQSRAGNLLARKCAAVTFGLPVPPGYTVRTLPPVAGVPFAAVYPSRDYYTCISWEDHTPSTADQRLSLAAFEAANLVQLKADAQKDRENTFFRLNPQESAAISCLHAYQQEQRAAAATKEVRWVLTDPRDAPVKWTLPHGCLGPLEFLANLNGAGPLFSETEVDGVHDGLPPGRRKAFLAAEDTRCNGSPSYELVRVVRRTVRMLDHPVDVAGQPGQCFGVALLTSMRVTVGQIACKRTPPASVTMRVGVHWEVTRPTNLALTPWAVPHRCLGPLEGLAKLNAAKTPAERKALLASEDKQCEGWSSELVRRVRPAAPAGQCLLLFRHLTSKLWVVPVECARVPDKRVASIDPPVESRILMAREAEQ
jgi:hypothetical protein